MPPVTVQCDPAAATQWTDTAVYADRNGLLVQALMRAAEQLADQAAARMAVAAAGFLLEELIGPEGQVYHCLHEGRLYAPGMLVDQMMVSAALRQVYEWSGEQRFLAGSEKALAWAEANLFDDEEGVFAQGPTTAIEGMSWPRQVRHRDTALPAGNALAADLYMMRGDMGRAGQLLQGLRLAVRPGRRHASYASALLRFGGR